MKDSVPAVSLGSEAKSVLIDIARPRAQWTPIDLSDLKRWCDNNASPGDLSVFMGLDVNGECVSIDLGAAPHMLLGGATGMGKSVCLHSVILSLLLRHKNDLQLALVDPKQVEFSPYSDLDLLFGGEVVSEATVALKLFQRKRSTNDAAQSKVVERRDT
nr:FtsK/SpoIIIE domain-containing protein [Caballeronia sp. GAWG1-5s-s]